MNDLLFDLALKTALRCRKCGGEKVEQCSPIGFYADGEPRNAFRPAPLCVCGACSGCHAGGKCPPRPGPA